MSRCRTDLRASIPQRKSLSSTKFPPVRGDWNTGSCPPSGSAQNWATDMVVGLPLRTVSPLKETKMRSPVTSPKEKIKEMVMRSSPKPVPSDQTVNSQKQLGRLNQQIVLLGTQKQQYLDRIAQLEKEIENLKYKNVSQLKISEQLRVDLKMKCDKLFELDEIMKKQEEQVDQQKRSLDEKDKTIRELNKLLERKNTEIEQMNEQFLQEKSYMKNEFEEQLEETSIKYQNELSVKEEKLKVLKSHMAGALKDNSRERQHQLEELTRELQKVSEEADSLKSKMRTSKLAQGGCKNCLVIEKQLQNKIIELQGKDIGLIDLQQLCGKMEKQLMQQDELLRLWAKSKGKVIR